MDCVARYRIVKWRVGMGITALLFLPFLLVPSGCHWGGHGATSPPPEREEVAGDNAAHAAAPEWLPPAVATEGAREADGISPPDNTTIGATEAVVLPASPLPEAKAGSDATAPRDNTARSMSPPSGFTAADTTSRVDAPSSAHRQKAAAALQPGSTASQKETRGASIPGWAKSPEELSYRIDFIGITMGYARFRYKGKVQIAGKPAYHLNVRAWTSGVLSFIYPINETIDYYLDAETLAPIRQEFTQQEKEKDDVAFYNQETGRITYRYRQSGKIRKEVDTIPSVYDPVSVAYYFRWRDLGVENRARNMYGGRKLYQISSRILGNERIRTDYGEVDTIAVVPVIRRDGKPDNKGDLKVWFSNDERRVPIRLYAKFHKIKDWTLVGELMPPAAKAGG
ncbi:DUF3108 domain-containing protein [Candidatus Deferrimicrobium sp.]|uniref:DUF3108 domain-containing protein n=1 Tax=Candidatus Deferrimicrobium sp. TaxID=3060586 RepID=UPI002ED3EC0B